MIRQVTDVKHMVEPEHRVVKRVTRPMFGFTSCAAAHNTLVEIALRHMRKKGQLVGADAAEGLTPVTQFYALAASPLINRPHDILTEHLRHNLIGWPGATIPLLTAFIPDAILIPTASWLGNLVRGTKLRRQEVQPCPG
jgi:hypothetical protein